MLKYGLISEMDTSTGFCRVKFLDDNIVSPPMQITFMSTQGTKIFFPFEVNTCVACIMDEHGDNGVVVGAIYQDEDKPDENVSEDAMRIVFSDGAIIEYNFKTNKFTFDGENSEISVVCEKAEVTASSGVKISGDLEITGDVTVGGKIDSTGDVTSGSGPTAISLLLHKHVSAAPGSPTGPSIP